MVATFGCDLCGTPWHSHLAECVSKPATPEPPVWKAEDEDWKRIARLGQHAYGKAVAAIVNRPDYIPGTVTNTGVGVGTVDSAAQSMTVTNPNTPKRGWLPHWKGDHRVMADGSIIYRPDRDPSPLDRALSDFIARRKAKRERNPAPTSTEIVAALAAERAEHEKVRAFARAFSLPISFTARLGMKQP